MALLTVERSLSLEGLLSSSTDDADYSSTDDKENDDGLEGSLSDSFGSKHPKIGRLRSPSFAGYFASRGGAVSIPDGSKARTASPLHSRSCGELQMHLQTMITILREDDIMKMAVRIESQLPDKKRYLTLVASPNEESLLVGIDWVQGPTIGLVLELPSSTIAKLDGDGGFHVSFTMQRTYCFKPVSVQTLWSAMHVIQRGIDNSAKHTLENEGYRDFVNFYQSKIESDVASISEWNMMDNLLSTRQFDLVLSEHEESEQAAVKKLIRPKLKEVMIKVDLDTVTSRQIRNMCEEELGMDLSEFKSYIDTEMFMILGQMDSASKIFDYLYLGSEWNASDFEELKRLGIGYILNLTKEIDNFFPDSFVYFNVRVYDEEDTELLPYWEHTYKFIHNAKLAGSNVLVHCRRGISRSASSVIAYVMKSQNWSLTESMEYVKNCRSIVEPNAGFERQLIIYEGILNSSRHRYNVLFRQRSKSERQISSVREKRRMFKSRRSKEISDEASADGQTSTEDTEDIIISKKRPKSWACETSRDEEKSTERSILPSLVENPSRESPLPGKSMSMEESQSSGESPEEDNRTNENEDIDTVDGDAPFQEAKLKRRMMTRAKTLPCQSTRHWELTRQDDKLAKEDAAEQEKDEELVEQAMVASMMKRQLLRSLVQLQEKKGTRMILDNQFSVESIVRPSSLRKISMSRQLPFERRKSFSEETDMTSRFRLRKRAMTVGATKYYDNDQVDDNDKDDDDDDDDNMAVKNNNHRDIVEEETLGFLKHENSEGRGAELDKTESNNNNNDTLICSDQECKQQTCQDESNQINSEKFVIETSQFKTVKDTAKEFEERQKLRHERLSRKPRRHTVGECEIRKEMEKVSTQTSQSRSKSSEGRKTKRDVSSSPLHNTSDRSNDNIYLDANPRLELVSTNQNASIPSCNRTSNQSEAVTKEDNKQLLLDETTVTSQRAETSEDSTSGHVIEVKNDHVMEDDSDYVIKDGGDHVIAYGSECNITSEQDNEDVSVRDLVEKHKSLIHKNTSASQEDTTKTKSFTDTIPSSVGDDIMSYSDKPQGDQIVDVGNNESNNYDTAVTICSKNDDDNSAKDTEVVQPGIVKRQSLLLAKAFSNEPTSEPTFTEPMSNIVEPNESASQPELSNENELMQDDENSKAIRAKRNSVKKRLEKLEAYQKSIGSSNTAIKQSSSLHSEKGLDNEVMDMFLSTHIQPNMSSRSAPPSPRITRNVWDKEHYSSLDDISSHEPQIANKDDYELSPSRSTNEIVKSLVDKFEEY